MQARAQREGVRTPYLLRYRPSITQGTQVRASHHPPPPAGTQPSHLSPLQFSSSCCSHWCMEDPKPPKVSMGVGAGKPCAPAQQKCQPQRGALTHLPPGSWGASPCEHPPIPMPSPCAECGCRAGQRERLWGGSRNGDPGEGE